MSNVIKTTGQFVKTFDSFEEGLAALRQLSFSASDALGNASDEESAVSRLATNVAFDRPTGNGVGWSQCAIKLDAYGVEYCTRRGLGFGWTTHPDADMSGQMREDGGTYDFFITHPSGENISLDSSLGVSAREHGWSEIFEDGYARQARAYTARPKSDFVEQEFPDLDLSQYAAGDEDDESYLGASTLAKLKSAKLFDEADDVE